MVIFLLFTLICLVIYHIFEPSLEYANEMWLIYYTKSYRKRDYLILIDLKKWK